MAKLLNFDEAMERLNDERPLNAGQVTGTALKRVVWIAEWHIPGCLSESRSLCLTKAEAIKAACSMAEVDGEAPRGMNTAMRKFHRFDCPTEMYGSVINTISKHTLHDLL